MILFSSFYEVLRIISPNMPNTAIDHQEDQVIVNPQILLLCNSVPEEAFVSTPTAPTSLAQKFDLYIQTREGDLIIIDSINMADFCRMIFVRQHCLLCIFYHLHTIHVELEL